MEVNNSNSSIQEYQDNVAELFTTFSEGIQQLLQRKDLSSQDQTNFAKTAQIVDDVAKRYYATAEEVGELEAKRSFGNVEYLRHTIEMLLIVKEKEANLVLEEFQTLREQAEFLKLSLEGVAAAEEKLLPFNRKEMKLKCTHPHFEGREEVFEEITKKLNSAVPVVLYGSPGVGKSETAIAYANRHIKDYSVAWTIYADTAEKRDQGYRELAEVLNLPIFTSQQLHSRVHRKLEQLEHPWLLIFDNLEENIEFPQRGGNILITARDKELFPLYEPVEIPPFSEKEGIAILKKVTGEEESKEMKKLAQFFSYPVVLGHIARYIRQNPSVTIWSFFQKAKISDTFEIEANERYQVSLKIALEQSFTKLPKEALAWLKICAHLNPDRIPKAYLNTWIEICNEPKTENSNQMHILSVLANRGFLRYDPKSETLSIHRLFQEYLKGEESYVQAAKFLKEMIQLLEDEKKDTTMKSLDVLGIHVSSIVGSPYFEKINEQEKVVFLETMGEWFIFRWEFVSASEKFLQAMRLRENFMGKKDKDFVGSLENVGFSLMAAGKPMEALEYFERGVEIVAKIEGFSQLYFANFIENVGVCLSTCGEHQKALENLRKGLEIRECLFRTDQSCLAKCWCKIGDCLMDQGSQVKNNGHRKRYYEKYWKEALEAYQKGLMLFKIADIESLETAECLHEIGNCFSELEQNEESLENHREALRMREKVCGTNHPLVANSMNHIGSCLVKKKKWGEGLTSIRKGEEIQKNIFGSDHFSLMPFLRNTAECLLKQKKYLEALNYFEDVSSMEEKIFGINFNDSVNLFQELQHRAEKEKEYKEALKFHILLGMNEKNSSVAHWERLLDRGFFAQKSGRYEEAMEYFIYILATKKKALNANCTIISSFLNKLTEYFEKLKKYEEAMEDYQIALGIKKDDLVSADMAVEKILGCIYSCLADQRNEPFEKRKTRTRMFRSSPKPQEVPKDPSNCGIQ